MFENITHLEKWTFLNAYLETGNVRYAARIAKIDRSTHYVWRRTDAEYAEAFKLCQEIALDALEDEAYRRGRFGVREPIVANGQIIGHRRKYSDGMLAMILKGKRREIYGDKSEVTGADGAPLIPAPSPPAAIDWTLYTTDELQTIERLALKARNRGLGGPAGGTGPAPIPEDRKLLP